MPRKLQKGSKDKQGLKKKFSAYLLDWDCRQNRREMPWKGEKDPYRVWLSEIILQQTRVEQGQGYYNRFVNKYPDVFSLAKASDNEVFRLWEGLGYYSRCRNLLATARFIATELHGQFPASYEELLKLQGIGPYTAAAISSFAYDLPHAVVDGNVYRLISRIFGIRRSVDTTDGKRYFNLLANHLLDKANPGAYNQAIMDFGALVCKPKPVCEDCVFQKTCFAFLNRKTSHFPVKEKKKPARERWFNYLVLAHRCKIAIRQRNGKDIWQHLYEFPMIETKQKPDKAFLLNRYEKNGWLKKAETGEVSFSHYQQQLSHQLIHASFTSIRLRDCPGTKGWNWVRAETLDQYSFPRFLRNYIDTVLIA